MCSCDFNYVCLDHRGTQHDPWSEFNPDPREDDLAARYSGSEPTVEAADWRAGA